MRLAKQSQRNVGLKTTLHVFIFFVIIFFSFFVKVFKFLKYFLFEVSESIEKKLPEPSTDQFNLQTT